MASTSEKGFAKQLAEFEDFTTLISKLGTAYNPPKAELSLTNLQAQTTAAKSAMREISITMPPYSAAVDKQALAFKFLSERITKSLNYYKVCVSDAEEIGTAKSLADKIRGISKKKPAIASAGGDASKTISQSQMSYDSRIEFLKQYIDVLIASGVYNNPGNDINIDDFQLLLNQMEETNGIVNTAKTPLDVARNKRNLIFYTPITGIGDLVMNVKLYIKATLPKDNPHYRALNGFIFKRRSTN